ncbi:non-ribosomal peptide synthetase [Flavobacterium sp. B183]|uniref:non-ribosomal peptide synthetase n=1 Tax=Flavobacterium sp. B183 TaxID=907046 RepID=UPI00201F62E2|nr:non-ribosomal peptide synthetase [Flavobacterium sp. B183]URC11724.1 amino acid adenylation domain-containing protein [Flavobacterium sp. B183]
MEFSSFFERLNKEGIKLVLNGDLLSVKSNTNIDPAILLEIKNNKELIIQYLKKYQDENTTEELLKKITPYNRNTFTKIPLSFSQERLWFLDQFGGSAEYNMPIVLHLDGTVSISILEEALQTIVLRHEVLRSMLLSEEGIAYQQIISAEGWSLDTEIISDELVLKNQIAHYINQPFDLSKDYKLRACLYTLGNQKYVLACVFHHIASDGWSEGILVNEFTQLYSALQSNSVPNLPTLHLQYADYAIWQRNYLEGAVLEDQLSYWESKLSGVSTLSLPTDYPRPSVPSNAGAAVSLALDQKLKTSLNAICKEEGVTLFMLLLSAFKILLSRYSGQEDICVGTPIANRTQAELEGMIGFFVNTLALRSDLSGDPSFKDVLSRVKQTTLEGYDHQLTPFEKVVDRVVTSRDRSMSPLFQVMFVLQNEGDNQVQKESELHDIIISGYEFDTVSSKFDLTFSASENNNGISLTVNYCTALFDKATIESMLLHYQELLQSIVSSTKQPISTLSMLSQAEEHQLLNVFNNTEAAYPSDKTIVDLFIEQVKQTPNAVAVVYEDEKLTYKELNQRSNQLAYYLREQGVKPDALVGICLERSLEMLIGILGILKSGGAYVPIDPEYPTDRIAYMLKDAGIDLVVSSQTSCNVINRGEDISVLCLDKDWDLISGYPTAELSTVLTASNLAYVIYTSGSTGTPKGVMNEHSGIVNRLLWTQSHYQLKSDDAILQKTSFSFDVSVWEFLWAISCGARLVFAKPEGHKDVEYLKQIIEKENITTIHFVPSMLRVFLEDINLGDCKSLKQVLCSGEALQVDQVLLFKEKFRNVRLDNLYGPTEAAIDVSSWEVPLEDVLSQVLIGKPVVNTSLYVLDHQNQLVPIGVIGELCIGGAQVARGYLNKEELTKEKFIANPFKEGERIYKTGDLARWLPDGNIEYIGRKDDQVKIRGYRIELGEIENALSSLAGINQCCVLAKEDTAGNKRLVGYVVLEGELNKETLQNQLKLSLPEYMVPQLWVTLEKMPLTSNGKLDKKALPDPDGSDLSSTEYVAPRNETETQLAAIWQNLLGVEQIGIHDNFFELGGHSLLATRLVSMIRKELIIEVSIREVFEHATISDLAAHIAAQSGVVLLPGIVAEERPARIPLSFSQERLWFLDQLQGSTEYHIPIVLSLEGALDISLLEQTLHGIVSRHEVLRSMLLSEEGIGYQQIISAEGWSLDTDTVSDELVLKNHIAHYAHKPFDLSKDYKLRACLYTLENQKYVLACVFHHIASDAWSGEILVHEFMELYSSFESNSTPNLPTLHLQYADYAIWQRKHLEGAVLEDQLSYWESKLKGVSTLSLPTDYARALVPSNAGAAVSLEIDQKLSASLNTICKEEGVTMFMLLLSAFKVLLSRYSGQEDICVGTSIANRTQSDLEGMIGFFVNTLALRSDLSGNPSFKDLLSRVKQTTLESYDHQLAPFEKVVDRVITTRDRNMSPLFQVLFSLQNNQESNPVALKGLSLSSYDTQVVNSQFDLLFNISENQGGISLNMVYSTALFEKTTIERMLLHYQELLQNIAKNITEPVKNLSLLTPAEEHQLLNVFNHTTAAYPLDKTIVDLFTEQVKKTPAAIAVVCGDETLSYQELDAKSNDLALYLQNHYHVTSNDIVGLMLDRSIWSIISIIGTLKAGACYLPIDKEYPENRKSFLVKDANVKLLIIESESLFDVIEYAVPIFSIDVEFDSVLSQASSFPALKTNTIQLSDLVYVIYTSGSTGNPKGVMIEHNSLVNYLSYSISHYGDGDNAQSFPLFSSLSFDLTQTSIYLTLLTGGQLHIYKDNDVSSVLKAIVSNDAITSIKLTPSHLSFFRDLGHSPLKRFIIGGEQLTHSDLSHLGELDPSVKLFNEYGPTESTIGCSVLEVTHYESLDRIHIGRPVGNTHIYIVNEALGLLPIGVTGELCVGGIQVARGYLNREELTNEKFIDSPFLEGERMYKTGDLARWLPDGNIEYIGRKDDQVKIRGYRIELGEIENALSSLAGVNQCCVLAKEDTTGNKRLVGYVVLEGELNKEQLQNQLKLSLPQYMVPQLWVTLDTMPLTDNGKLDKKALPDPDGSELSSKEYVAPRNDTETQLAEIWQNLLGVERVGIHDDFFELGGHSLLATRLVSMIRKELSKEIEIADVFAYTTISDLETHLSSQSEGVLLPVITGGERPERIPLSFSQERLWFLDQLQGSTEYHIPIVLSLEGALEISLLEQTLHGIVSRHEVLRSMLLSEEGIAYQQIISAEGWSLDTENISDELVLKNQIADYVNQPFDLSKDYKLRACLYTLGNQKYVLACVFHHIASDGWSEGILVNEFTQLYSALQSNSTPNLPTLHLQYADYAIWQRNYLEGVVLEDQLSYWESKLSGVSTLSLPTDYPRPSVPSNAGAAVFLALDQKLKTSLNAICKEEGVTLFMLLLSAFKILLSRYSGQEDICVGTPIANRTQAELEGMIGFFVNTLALRSDLSGDPSFKDVLSRVKQTTLEGYDHQLTPFEKVVDRVVTSRDRSMSPLFQVMFVLQNEGDNQVQKENELHDIIISGYEFDTVSSKFDLTFSASENNNGISLVLNYCTALFDKATIESMLLHYQELLASIVGNIKQPISTLSMLTQAEEHQLLNVFNNTEAAYPSDKTIVDLFEEQVKQTPNAVAVVYGDEKLTYKELDQRSNQLGHYLREQGVKPDALVGICLERSLEMLIGILGILKSGGAYVPIDPEYPTDRIAYMLKDAGIDLVVSSQTSCNVINKELSVLCLDKDWELISGYPTTALSTVLTASNLAYVIYTSGSTGTPKGVLITHKNVVRLFKNESPLYDFGSGDVWTLFHSFCFDFSVWEMYGALLHGGRLVVVPKSLTKDAVSFKELLIKEGVTVLNQTPGSFYVLQEEFLSKNSLHSLRYVIFGGEALNSTYLERWKRSYVDCKLINMYGITETTVHVTYKEITESDTQSLISNIGTAIPTLGCYIVDAHLNLVPIGVEGELCISGAGVARGYLNREDLTNEKFIANPFSVDKTSRLYRSGDLARWLPDGNIEYIGRKDDQVKIRGYRIELGEIENILSSLEGVSQCCVLAKEDTAGNKRLVGYVVLEGALNKEQLQNQLKLSLPQYMVPQLWVTLDTMPLTGNGKLDKKALPDPDGSELSSKEYVAPRNETEAQLAEIWQNLLGVEQVGIHDNFFELGGHSLLATRLVSMIRKDLKREVSIREVFEHTTISELGTHLSSQSEGVLLPVITRGERPERIPLSYSQERLWFLDQLQGSTEYHIPIVLSLEGALEISLLEQTLHGIVSRHEVLRSMLLSEEGIAYQQIISAEGWSLDTEIISDELVLKNQIADYVNQPFDLSKDYKLRACLYTLGNQKYVLACVFHHIASDGWSEGILVNEFTQLYSALQSNSTPNLPTLHLQYADYAIWQRNYLEGAVLEDQLSYWESKLSDVSTLSLPTDYPRPSVPSNAGAAVSLALDQKLKTSLNAICKEEGVTLFMLLLSAFKILLSRYSGQEDICVGTPIANRTQAELEGMIGFFVNTLALRSDLSGDPSFRDVLSRVKQTTLEGYDHQLTPFEKVVDRVVTSRDRSMSPLFQVMFVLQNEGDNQVQKENELHDIIISGYEFDTVSSKFDLTFSASENNNGISLVLNYCTALFDKATIESMLLHYQELVQSIVGNIKQPISTLSMLTQAEEHQLLNVFNNTEAAYPSDKTIVDLFEEQVKQTPNAVAVVYEDEKLTYKELNQRSNQLAYYLREQGVKPDALVGICLERSLEMLIGILGILKSGGAYVPIDPEYPTDRIAYMLKDAGIDLVVSSQTSCNVINRGEDISVLCLDKDWELISGYPTTALSTVLTASNLAYVIYTSGSTGTPKGVMNEHSGIVNRLLWTQSHYQLKSDDAILQKTSFSFDVSVWEFLWAISCGARLVFAKPEGHKDVEYLKQIIEKENITTIHFVPSMLRVFLEDINLGDCKSLKQVLCSGEALQVDQVLLFKEKFRNVRLDNLYGPTEAAIDVSSWEVPLEDVLSQVLIGKPVANTSLYVLDHQNQLVPIGVIGELCIGGVQVARGYLNKEELTKEKFIANPFKEGERIYKTGDLARWLSDGNIEYIGRKDDQVKIRGYRIELGEIENALSSLAGVNQCCVLAKEDTAGNKRLVGYVVLEGALDKERLQNQLKLSLPEYMVPQLWVTLEKMPLTSNGKLDKKALPDPDGSDLSSTEYVAPRNETEAQLAAIWQNLLGVEQIGIHDNFFELGGHSLLATRLVSMIRKEFEIEITIKDIFEFTRIEELGTYLRHKEIKEKESQDITYKKIITI